jgi:hypothetical protein
VPERNQKRRVSAKDFPVVPAAEALAHNQQYQSLYASYRDLIGGLNTHKAQVLAALMRQRQAIAANAQSSLKNVVNQSIASTGIGSSADLTGRIDVAADAADQRSQAESASTAALENDQLQAAQALRALKTGTANIRAQEAFDQMQMAQEQFLNDTMPGGGMGAGGWNFMDPGTASGMGAVGKTTGNIADALRQLMQLLPLGGGGTSRINRASPAFQRLVSQPNRYVG